VTVCAHFCTFSQSGAGSLACRVEIRLDISLLMRDAPRLLNVGTHADAARQNCPRYAQDAAGAT